MIYRHRNLLLGLLLCASSASAGTITQFTAISTGFGFFMQVSGVDDQGNQLSATYMPLDSGSYPDCGCVGGTVVQTGGISGNGLATVNGVIYSDRTYLGQNETGFLSISGALPPITEPVGWQGVVTFPITWMMDFTFWQNGSNFSVVPLFHLNGFGPGTASLNATVIDTGNGPGYSGADFTYASDVPETPSGILTGLGLTLFVFIPLLSRYACQRSSRIQ